MKIPSSPQAVFYAFLYGGACVLLVFNSFFFIEALTWSNFVPIVPIVAGTLSALGLLLVVMAEGQARQRDKEEHRRLSRVAHQLEAPLKGLQMDIEEVMQQGKKLPGELRLTLKHMETKTTTLLENIRDVFLMMRAQEGAVATDSRLYNVCTLVQEAIAREQPFAKARNVELLHQFHCEDASVRVDRQLFLVALTHLIKNALTYTLTPGLVNIAIHKDRKQAVVTIQDRGIGIGKKQHAVVWQPFVRGAEADRFDPDGIGVGLTLAQLLITEFGGAITARRRNDSSGMQFEIKLSLAKK